MRAEAKLELAIRQALEYHGCRVWSTSAKRQRGPSGVSPGVPDLYVVDPIMKRSCFMEVKTPKGRLSPAQRDFRAVALAAGQTCLVVRSVDDAVGWAEDGVHVTPDLDGPVR